MRLVHHVLVYVAVESKVVGICVESTFTEARVVHKSVVFLHDASRLLNLSRVESVLAWTSRLVQVVHTRFVFDSSLRDWQVWRVF